MAPIPYTVERTDDNLMCVIMNDIPPGWEQWFLYRADAHHDNLDCRQDLEKQDLEEAKQRNAGIIDSGDLFCAMQGKWDGRSSKEKCRPENQKGDYLDSLVNSAVDFYSPYAHNFLTINPGNHETAIKRHHETDLSQRLVTRLNERNGSNIQMLGYTGWVWFKFKISSRQYRQVLWFTHGYGGGGPVTHDTIQAARQKVYIEGADIMCSGHVHRSWCLDDVVIRPNVHGKIERRTVWYIKTPTYKDSYKKGLEGFETERGHGPRPLGAWWIQFRRKGREIKTRIFKTDS